MDETQKVIMKAPSAQPFTDRRGQYDEFIALTPASYGRVALVEELMTVLKEEFWAFILELDEERQEVVLLTLKNNPDLILKLVKDSQEDLILSFLDLPEKFRTVLSDIFLQGIKLLLPGDPRRSLAVRVFGKADFLEETELRGLALKIKDGEIETIFSGLNAKQISVFAKALPLAKLLDLPNIVKRATVLAQIKSVICAETEADPKLKQVCTTGKWAAIRIFGSKKQELRSKSIF